MRVLFLTKYTHVGASSRYRAYQYLPHLEEAGFHCVVSPLFDDAYLANRYRLGRGEALDLLRAFLRRILVVLRVRRFDLVIIEYELIPYFPALFERMLSMIGCRYVVDYDDALFHQYDMHRNALVRNTLGGKIATVMRNAALVLVGNEYLARYARKAGARWVELLPTVIDLDRYPMSSTDLHKSPPFVVGWIGSPSTAKYLYTIAPALAEVCRGGELLLRMIGAGAIDLPGVTLELLPWAEDTEVVDMQSFDVGIMPLTDEPWARGKCGFKLIQYMACSLPVVASPVGVNAEIVEDQVNGFLAGSHVEWVEILNLLRDNSEERYRMGRAGRKKVEERFSLEVTAPRLVKLLKEAVIRNSE